MGYKKASESIKMKRKLVKATLEVKKEIIRMYENSVRVSGLALQLA